MANCVQVLTFDQVQPVSGLTTWNMDELGISAPFSLVGDDATDAATLASVFNGHFSGTYDVVVDYETGTIRITFEGTLAGYDWPSLSIDYSGLTYADTTPVASMTQAYSQRGTLPFTTLYFRNAMSVTWETVANWWRDAAHSVPATGYPGSQGGANYSVYMSDAAGGSNPSDPVASTTLDLFDTSGVTGSTYSPGTNFVIADNGTLILGSSGGTNSITFSGSIGNGCTVTVQAASVLSAAAFGASTATVSDSAYVNGTTFGSNGAVVNWNSSSVGNGIESSTFNGTTTIDAYANLQLSANTYAVEITVNLKVGGLTVTDPATFAVVDEVPTGTVPSASDVRLGIAVGSGTGTLAVPATNKVLTGTAVDATTGTLTLPTAGQVLSAISFGIGGNGTTGNVTLPAVTLVVAGTAYGVGGTGSTGTYTVVATGNVRSGTAFGAAGALTGTLAVPTAGNVLTGVSVDAGTGTLTLPTANKVLTANGNYGVGGTASVPTLTLPAVTAVLSGTAYGIAGTGSTGTYVTVSTGNVRSGINYGASSSLTGICHVPTASQTLSGVSVDTGGTGNVVLPGITVVLAGTAYGVGGNGSIGSLTVPSQSDVRSGVTYGVGGSTSTGSCAVPTASQVLIGIGVDATVGNVTQASTGDVRSGTTYGPSLSLTGTLDVSSGSPPVHIRRLSAGR